MFEIQKTILFDNRGIFPISNYLRTASCQIEPPTISTLKSPNKVSYKEITNSSHVGAIKPTLTAQGGGES